MQISLCELVVVDVDFLGVKKVVTIVLGFYMVRRSDRNLSFNHQIYFSVCPIEDDVFHIVLDCHYLESQDSIPHFLPALSLRLRFSTKEDGPAVAQAVVLNQLHPLSLVICTC